MAKVETNRVDHYADIFKGIQPWSGFVPRGYLVDFLGVLTDARFRTCFGVDPSSVEIGRAHV